MVKYGTRLKTPSLDHILRLYDQSTVQERKDGGAWYPSAHQWCKSTGRGYGLGFKVVAAVVATLSPKISWTFAVRDTLTLLDVWVDGQDFRSAVVSAVGANKRKAIRILLDGRPQVSGPKVSAFYANLSGDYNRVTIDVWMYRAAVNSLDERATWLTPRQYERFEELYIQAGEVLGWVPAHLQATLWLTVQRLAGVQAIPSAPFSML